MSGLKQCPKCNEQINAKAKKCKHCNSDIRSWFVRHKIISAFLVLVVLSVIGNALKDDKRPSTSSSNDVVAEEKVEAIKVTSNQLMADYKKNEIAADEKYKGKMLEVSGVVGTVGKDILDSMYVTLKTNDVIGSVQCMLEDSEKSKAASLNGGQQITVVGSGNGKLMNVMLDDCRIK